jgi:hypothetical protein
MDAGAAFQFPNAQAQLLATSLEQGGEALSGLLRGVGQGVVVVRSAQFDGLRLRAPIVSWWRAGVQEIVHSTTL